MKPELDGVSRRLLGAGQTGKFGFGGRALRQK